MRLYSERSRLRELVRQFRDLIFKKKSELNGLRMKNTEKRLALKSSNKAWSKVLRDGLKEIENDDLRAETKIGEGEKSSRKSVETVMKMVAAIRTRMHALQSAWAQTQNATQSRLGGYAKAMKAGEESFMAEIKE